MLAMSSNSNCSMESSHRRVISSHHNLDNSMAIIPTILLHPLLCSIRTPLQIQSILYSVSATSLTFILISMLFMQPTKCASFSNLSFQHITNEDFNGVNMDIGWIQFASCTEGCTSCDNKDHSLIYPNGSTQQQMIDIARYAITVKILPSTDIPGNETTEYAVKADICSNPIYSLNNGFELSFTVNTSTSLITEFTSLSYWIGSINAKSRMSNSCTPAAIASGSKPALLADSDRFYHACGNLKGLHITSTTQNGIMCMYNYLDYVGHNISVWIGFDKNKTKTCKVYQATASSLIWHKSENPITQLKNTYAAAVGVYDKNIWLIGGGITPNAVFEIDVSTETLITHSNTIRFGAFGSQKYCQRDTILFMHQSTNVIIGYDLQTQSLAYAITAKYSVVEYTCISVNEYYLFNTGGSQIGIFHIYDFNSSTWYDGTSMLTNRAQHGCNIVNNMMYVIGGKINDTITESVHVIDLSDPSNNPWNVFPDSLSVARLLVRSVVYNHFIYVTGKMQETVDIIDTITEKIWYDSSMNYAKDRNSPVILNAILYSFGGLQIQYYEYAVLPTAAPSAAPTNAPSLPSLPPTNTPSALPSIVSEETSNSPFLSPTDNPSNEPPATESTAQNTNSTPLTAATGISSSNYNQTQIHSLSPTDNPSNEPTNAPTYNPTHHTTLNPFTSMHSSTTQNTTPPIAAAVIRSTEPIYGSTEVQQSKTEALSTRTMTSVSKPTSLWVTFLVIGIILFCVLVVVIMFIYKCKQHKLNGLNTTNLSVSLSLIDKISDLIEQNAANISGNKVNVELQQQQEPGCVQKRERVYTESHYEANNAVDDENASTVAVSGDDGHLNGKANNGDVDEHVLFTKWLTQKVKLPKYYDLLKQNGFETLEVIMEITHLEELKKIGITKHGHVLKFMKEIQRLKENVEQTKEGENTARCLSDEGLNK